MRRFARSRAAPKDYEEHLDLTSGRRGLVATGRKKGKRVEKLRKQGDWATNSAVFWEYIDEGEMFEDAATDGIGL
ncbi:hypothetical protein ACFY2M_43930 [Streptomyces sp. NPDC001276]|uniref:hypothetical protein n=1 Tax=Streptomyces sp. NPDC001276 TaxID=3364555 RepID=UPI0036C6E778